MNLMNGMKSITHIWKKIAQFDHMSKHSNYLPRANYIECDKDFTTTTSHAQPNVPSTSIHIYYDIQK